jgi:hypothetical protein
MKDYEEFDKWAPEPVKAISPIAPDKYHPARCPTCGTIGRCAMGRTDWCSYRYCRVCLPSRSLWLELLMRDRFYAFAAGLVAVIIWFNV